jgi:sugar phosphate isomerase/epimerase
VNTKLNWRLGCQAYTFRNFTLFETIEKNAALGLQWLEAYPQQRLDSEKTDLRFDHHCPPELVEAVKEKLDAEGVRLVHYGVVGLPNDEAQCRQVFEFAKALGVETLVSEPPADALDLVDALCIEYDINMAIHNHPTPSLYWDPSSVVAACRGRSRYFGACADTGHWSRSGVNPIEALKMLEGRILGVHLKDIEYCARDAADVPWGTGVCDVKGILAELQRQGVEAVFSIEYESNAADPFLDIAECIEWFGRVCAEAV